MADKPEILDPRYRTRAEAAPVVNRAVKHYRGMTQNAIRVMADLRTLQDRGVHLLYGENNFATWAVQTFDGMGASNVKQLTRAGGVALTLAKYKRLNLDKPEGVGVTGLRELSIVANAFGDEKMIEVFDTAAGMGEQDVSDKTVKAAMQLLMPPAAADLEIPEAVIDHEETEDDLTGDDGYDEDKYPPAIRERISRIQDLSWDLPESADEIALESAGLVKELAEGRPPDDSEWLNKGR
jgi:hypothetical protein